MMIYFLFNSQAQCDVFNKGRYNNTYLPLGKKGTSSIAFSNYGGRRTNDPTMYFRYFRYFANVLTWVMFRKYIPECQH